ncbi:hypothetical protein KTR9_3488 [Gordonia sp. KTR9]|nr:hypothetical protein KTR9_3488 [Gordonia sp. KTR9]
MSTAEDRSFLSRDDVAHLLVDFDGVCWWCRSRPATTGEHKYKASDLVRLMSGDTLLWGDDTGQRREIRGKSGVKRDRYGVVKFPKSMCDRCNNARSQPFDLAYDTFSDYLVTHPYARHLPGIGFADVYGMGWQPTVLNLARYYAKHFGCQMVRTGIEVPQSVRDFLNGADDMIDAHMALVTTDSIHDSPARKGLTISPGAVFLKPDYSRVDGCVFACYVGSIGVRYEWRRTGIPDNNRSQFFHHPNPLINCFANETQVVHGEPRPQGKIARLFQWLNKPSN